MDKMLRHNCLFANDSVAGPIRAIKSVAVKHPATFSVLMEIVKKSTVHRSRVINSVRSTTASSLQDEPSEVV